MFCLFILGCGDKISEELLAFSKVPQGVTFSQRYTLVLSDSLDIALPKDVPAHGPGIDNVVENDSIYYFIDLKNRIIKVNLFTSTIDIVNVPLQEGTGDLMAICHPSAEKFILLRDFPEGFIIKEGDKATHYTLPKISFPSTNKSFNKLSKTFKKDEANFTIDYGNLHFDSENNQLHIGLEPLNAYDSEGFENCGRIGIFNLSNLDWDGIYAPPEGMLKHKGDRTYPYLLSIKNTLFKNDTMFVSYVNDHHVYYYRQSQYLGKFPHISTKSKEMFLPVDLDYASDIENMKTYENAAPYYGIFYYHEKLKLYSRIYYDQQEPLDSNGKYHPPYLLRNIYVVFLDENFNHVGEFKFPFGSLQFESAIPVSDGFFLYSTKYNITDSLNQNFRLKYKYTITPDSNTINKTD